MGEVRRDPKPFEPVVLTSKVAVFVDLFRAREQIRRDAEELHALREREREQSDARHSSELMAEQLRLSRRVRQSELAADVGTALTRIRAPGAMLQACAEAIVRHLDAAFARIWTVDATGRTLELQASAGMYTHLDGPHGHVPVGAYKIGRIAQERTPHLTNDVANDPQVGNPGWARREGMVAFAGYPLVLSGSLVGVIAMFARAPLADDVLGALATTADAVSVGIGNRRAEASLRASEAWLATTLQCIGDGVIATDATGKVTLLNPVASRLTGWTAEDAKGRALEEVFVIANETTRATVESPVAKVLREGTVVGLANHTILIRKDGSGTAIDDSAAPIRGNHTEPTEPTEPGTGASGELTGVVLVFRDASQKRAAETERERLLAQAQAANALKDEFLATVSHELRTPLTAILGWSRMLRTGMVAESRRTHALETIERNARAQAQLVDDLLDISRIITGKLRLDMQSVDLTTVVSAALDVVRPAAEAKDIQLQSVVDPDVGAGAVTGDAGRLQQVVWNLLTNAVKFTPRHGHIQIQLQRSDSSVEIVVTDGGQGIEPDFLPHVFERLRQAEGSITRSHGGLGLGLAIVKNLVEMHGGTIRAHSEGRGHGATFTVCLPMAAVREDRSVRRAPRPGPGDLPDTALPAVLTGLRVLVLDDEPDTRDLLATVLEHGGVTVHVTASAAEALAAMGSFRPDVLLSDIGMPGEDGYTLIRTLRTPLPWRLIPASTGPCVP